MVEWLSLAVATGALAWTCWTYFSSRQSAQRSADSAVRAADALEAQVELMRQSRREPVVSWRIDRTTQSNWELVNMGDATALDVTLTPESGIVHSGPYRAARMRPGEAMPFLAQLTASGAREVTVAWTAEGKDTPESAPYRLH